MTHIAVDLWTEQREKAEKLPLSGALCLKDTTFSGKPSVRLWMPKGKKPYAQFCFSSEEERELYIRKQDENIAGHQKIVQKRKEIRMGNPELMEKVKVGFIFHHSWGWEQTNADFYQVVSKKGRHVKLCRVKSEVVSSGGSSMSAYVIARPFGFIDNSKIITRLVQFTESGNPYISISPHGWCDLYDGRPVYCSWYA